ncbi:hypothetical protein D3C83_165400 [compost metagenome]
MAQVAIGGGFEIGDLGDEFGFDPDGVALCFGRRRGEGACLAFQALELRQQGAEGFVVEASADAAAIDQLVLVFPFAEFAEEE